MSTGELKFDEMTVDTTLAEDFLKKHKCEFHSIGFNDNGAVKVDDANNKIYYSEIEIHAPVLDGDEALLNKRRLFRNLAGLISDNSKLFCQLEYLIRHVRIDDTKAIDLKLIINNLLNVMPKYDINVDNNKITMLDDSPLALLGFIANILSQYDKAVIVATEHTAVVCWLFTQLCHQAGFQDTVSLAFTSAKAKTKLSHMKDLLEYPNEFNGCVCVISAHSDVFSAVDIILDTPERLPWKLQRIFVQESIYNKFKSAMSSKTTNVDSELAALSTDAYKYGNKQFLYEYVGESQSQIVIEAYRTVKELIGLLNASKPIAVSLWCSDVTESNEIAYGVDTSIVWINDFGNFNGSPITSSCFYSMYAYSYSTRLVFHSDVNQVKMLKDKWLTKSENERIDIIYKALKTPLERDYFELIHTDRGFCSVGDGWVCTGFKVPNDIVHASKEWKQALSALLNGSAVILDRGYKNDVTIELMKAGAPIITEQGKRGDSQNVQPSNVIVKSVWSSFGTIFAN